MVRRLHRHARARMAERGTTKEEVALTVEEGERFDAKLGRVGFRRNFVFDSEWRGTYYKTNQYCLYSNLCQLRFPAVV